jgi:predicted phosphodiesterase
MKLASVLERSGLGIRNTLITLRGEAGRAEDGMPLFGIALFLVSPAALANTLWLSYLHVALVEGLPGITLVLVRPTSMTSLPKGAEQRLVLPSDGEPIATRKDRDDALLEVIDAVRDLAASQPREAPNIEVTSPPSVEMSIDDIFRLNGPPTVTFVEPPGFRELQLRLSTMGAGLIVEGPSKTGKSTAVHRAMDAVKAKRGIAADDQDELWWAGQALPALDEFRRVLDELRSAQRQRWVFIDDFHYVEDRHYLQALAFAMKALADQPISHAKVSLIGINPLGASLVATMPDLAGRIRVMRMDRARHAEHSQLVRDLIVRGEQAANVRFLKRDEFVIEAGGSFFIAQMLCNFAAVQAGIVATQRKTVEIERGPADVIAAIRGELAARYRTPMLHFAAFDIAPPPRGAALSLLWMLARSADGFVSLKEARIRFPHLSSVLDWFLSSNLSRCFEQHPDLRALLYFNRAIGTLTMEDPQLKFYLGALDWSEFAEASGHGQVAFHPADGPLWPITASVTAVGGGSTLTATGTISDPAPATPTRRLLHLSDLHFATADQADLAYYLLAPDLRQQQVEQLDALVVSGDLVNRADPAEYDAVVLFLERLKSGFGLKAQAMVIVPGNHDVSYPLGNSAYRLQKRDPAKEPPTPGTFIPHGLEVIEARDDEEAYLQRFEPFAQAYEKVIGEPYPLAYDEQATITQLPEAGLCILGLNSAWEIDRHFPNRASIRMTALARALERLPRPAGELRIAVFHHPIHSNEDSQLRDSAFLQQLAVAGFRLVLHGHVHRADATLYQYDRTVGGRRLDIVTAGTFGAPTREWVPGYPLQYNLLAIGEREITVETRCRRDPNGAWEPDARWLQGARKDPLPRYVIQR